MESAAEPFELVVVGGGIGGLAASIGLATHLPTLLGRPLRVIVAERDNSADDRRQGYRIGISDEGASSLEYLGCSEALGEILEAADTMRLFRVAMADTRLTLMLEFGTDGGGGLVSRDGFRKALVRQCEEVGVKLLWSKKFQSLSSPLADSRPVLTFADGSTLEADLVVAADGAKSPLRTFLFPAVRSSFLIRSGVYGASFSVPIRRIPFDDPDLRLLLDRTEHSLLRLLGPLAGSWLLLRFQDDELMEEVLVIVFNHRTDGGDYPDPSDRERCLAFVRSQASLTGSHPLIKLMAIVETTDVIFDPAPVLTSDSTLVKSIMTSLPGPPSSLSHKVVFLGDAAHAMTTHRGNGANTALLDAADLVRTLSPLLNATPSQLQNALSSYSTLIATRGAKNVSESLASTNSLHVSSLHGRFLRYVILWCVGSVVWSVRAVTRVLSWCGRFFSNHATKSI